MKWSTKNLVRFTKLDMDKKNFEKINNRAVDASGVMVRADYLDPEYSIKKADDLESACNEKNEVIVAELVPKQSTLPHFKFRSDGFGKKLDVDVYINGNRDRGWWRNNNCKGHHGEPSERPFYFKRDISCPERTYFKGSISIERLFQQGYSERGAQITGTLPKDNTYIFNNTIEFFLNYIAAPILLVVWGIWKLLTKLISDVTSHIYVKILVPLIALIIFGYLIQLFLI